MLKSYGVKGDEGGGGQQDLSVSPSPLWPLDLIVVGTGLDRVGIRD